MSELSQLENSLLEQLLKAQVPNASQDEINDAIAKALENAPSPEMICTEGVCSANREDTKQRRSQDYAVAASIRDTAIGGAATLPLPGNLAAIAAAWAAYAAACATIDNTICD